MQRHERLLKSCRSLPSDYTEYGGEVERWSDNAQSYADCSQGCKFFQPLHVEKNDYPSLPEYEGPDMDWGVCTNPDSPRDGLLTFEHQAGFGCYKNSCAD